MPEKTIPEVLGHSVSFPTGAQTETWPRGGVGVATSHKEKAPPLGPS